MSSTEIKPSDFFKQGEPLPTVWKLGKLFFKWGKKANAVAEERERKTNAATKKQTEIDRYKSELQEIGLGDIDSVRNARQKGDITLTEYMEIVKILKS